MKEEIIKLLKENKFKEIEEGYEFSNKKVTIFLDEDTVGIISDPDADTEDWLSIPHIKIQSKKYLFDLLKNLGIL